MKRTAILVALALTGAIPTAPVIARDAATANYAVGPQYDTTHVYVAPSDFDTVRAISVLAMLIVGGESHKTGQGGDTMARYRRIEAWARERFDVESVEYRWSTQDYIPAEVA